MKIVIRIVQICMAFFVLCFAAAKIVPAVIFCLLVILIAEWLLRQTQGKTKAQIKKNNIRQKAILNNQIPAYIENVKHISGLDTALEASCRVEVFASELRISTKVKTYHIPTARIRGAESIDSTNSHITNGGSVGRAIVWSFLAGPAAGIVAGMGKSREVQTHRYFTCVYYVSSTGNDECLVLENESPYLYIVDGLQQRKTTLTQEIQHFSKAGHTNQTL